MESLRERLDALYRTYNHRRVVDPDPLAPVLCYEDPLDQEIAGLVAASLAFGRVRQITLSVAAVLGLLPHPRRDLLGGSPDTLTASLNGFRHRYVTGIEMADLLAGMRRVLTAHGSLGACFAGFVGENDTTILPALAKFVDALREESLLERNYLLPDPRRGSACKRLMMYLRWMVRKDRVDVGAWAGLSPHLTPAKLVVPIDTHMQRICTDLGLTHRKAPDLRMALEVTEAFRHIRPDDPARYDFALTRLGIRDDADLAGFLDGCRMPPTHKGPGQ
jgi:uncharacterized protein (TIGR02757 family)